MVVRGAPFPSPMLMPELAGHRLGHTPCRFSHKDVPPMKSLLKQYCPFATNPEAINVM